MQLLPRLRELRARLLGRLASLAGMRVIESATAQQPGILALVIPGAPAEVRYPRFGLTARKIRELPVSWQLETRFSKNRILRMYLDRAYLGLGAEGFEEGAQLYFRKSVRQLDASEAAYLVGLLPSPNGYNICAPTPAELRAERLQRERTTGRPETPLPDEQVWTPKLRRDQVLGRMLAEGYLTQEQYRDAIRRPLIFDPSVCRQSRWRSYPFFSDYAMWELEGSRFSLNVDPLKEGGNYHVVATIDPGQPAETAYAALFKPTHARLRFVALIEPGPDGHGREASERIFELLKRETGWPVNDAPAGTVDQAAVERNLRAFASRDA